MGDGLKVRSLIAALGDDLSRGVKDARPCLSRIGTDRTTRSPAGGQQPGATSHEQTL